MIFGYHAPGVGESKLRYPKRNALLFLVFVVLLRIPLKPGFCREKRLAQIWANSHIIVWPIGGGYRKL